MQPAALKQNSIPPAHDSQPRLSGGWRALARVLLALTLLAAGEQARATQENCSGNLDRSNLANPVVELRTTLGSVCIELLEDQAPQTVANFLDYLRSGDIDGTFFHRAIAGFVLQGGGFRLAAGNELIVSVNDRAPVQNEPCVLDQAVSGPADVVCSQRGNVRGTLAMAKIGGNPNSATNQWFFNVVDNRRNLDDQNGGFTVFARVLGAGMLVVDQMVALPRLRYSNYNLNRIPVSALSAFSTLPVIEQPVEPAEGFGCFDIDQLAVLFHDTPSSCVPPSSAGFTHDECDVGSPVNDVAEPSNFAAVSGACGTALVQPDDFCDGVACTTTTDRFAWGVVENHVGSNAGQLLLALDQNDKKIPYKFTPAQLQESEARLADRRAGMTAQTADAMVFVEAAVLSPEIVSPAPGGNFDGGLQTFTWDPHDTEVQAWSLALGSTPGGNDFGEQVVEDPDATGLTFDNLPYLGRTVHATLSWKVTGQWLPVNSRRHVFTAGDVRDGPRDWDRDDFTNLEEAEQGTDLNDRDDWPMPVMLTPMDLTGHTQVFDWSFPVDLDVRRWQVRVGTTEGGRQILSARTLPGDTTELEVTKLPTQGGQVFVTLLIDRGRGFRNTKTFAFNAAELPAVAFDPDGGMLPGAEALFALERNGHDLTHWRVEAAVLSSSGKDRRVFRKTLRASDDEVTVTGLPTFGEAVVVKLDFRLSGGPWQSRQFPFEGATLGEPELTMPLPDGAADQLASDNSSHPRESVEFGWTPDGQPVNRWRLQVGTSRGGRELYRSPNLRGNVLSVDTRRLFDASPVYVRLFYRIGRTERFVDYLYNSDAQDPDALPVRPFYAAAAGLGLVAPVKNDGADLFSASGRGCRGNERGGHEACLQAGLMKVVTAPSSVTSCESVTASDLLDAFEWECRKTGTAVEVVSTGLKGELTDLIDFTTPGAPVFRDNQVIIEDGGAVVGRSSVLEPWWTTPVVALTPGDALLRDGDTVYVIEDAAHTSGIKLDRAARSVLMLSPAVAGAMIGAGAGAPGTVLVDVSRSPFAVVTGRYGLTGERTVLRLDRSPFAWVRDADLSGDTDFGDPEEAIEAGLHVTRSNNVLIEHTRVSHANSIGVLIERSAGVWVVDSDVVLNGEGVVFNRASGNGLHHVRVGHNTLSGVLIERGSDNHLHHLAVHNNGTAPLEPGEGHGIEVFHASSSRNHIAFAQVFNNAGHGVLIDGGRNTLMSNLTVFNHGRYGLMLDGVRDTTVLSVASLNNGGAGLGVLGRSQRTHVRDLVSAHNDTNVRLVDRSIRNRFTGLLTVGGTGVDCEVGPRSGDLGADCSVTGGSTHTLTTGVDASMSLIGKVTVGGPSGNGTGAYGRELVNDLDALLDVGEDAGQNLSRGWGKDHDDTFPSPTRRGPCVLGEACRIWSGAAKADDTGNDGSPVISGVLAIPGNEDVVQHRFRRTETFLEHASEILRDGVGDDDGLCESGEDCLLDLNIGAWQGDEGDGIADADIGYDLVPRPRRAPPAVEDALLDARDDTTVTASP